MFIKRLLCLILDAYTGMSQNIRSDNDNKASFGSFELSEEEEENPKFLSARR